MKKLFILALFSLSAMASTNTLTENFVVTKISLNHEKKYYEVSFVLMAGVYKADKEFVNCLQKSLESKKPAKVTYEAMGLKLTKCDI